MSHARPYEGRLEADAFSRRGRVPEAKNEQSVAFDVRVENLESALRRRPVAGRHKPRCSFSQ